MTCTRSEAALGLSLGQSAAEPEAVISGINPRSPQVPTSRMSSGVPRGLLFCQNQGSHVGEAGKEVPRGPSGVHTNGSSKSEAGLP